MALETASYPNQLVATNPTGADPKGQGDDHVRLLKRVMQATFPNITGPITVTQAQLNVLSDQTKLFQPNMIVLWGGAIVNIPAGWMLCSGAGVTSTGNPVPNLMDRFIVGAGSSYGVGFNGGSITHDHYLQINGTALTVPQMPAHQHSVTYYRSSGANTHGVPGLATDLDIAVTAASSVTGESQPHSHSGQTVAGTDTRPPYYALAYIIKY